MALFEERLVELINLASVEVDGTKKLEYLHQIKELALNHGLVDTFFQNILAFQNERAPNVKKFVLAFIEAACKNHSQLCPGAIFSLNLLLNDTNTEVIKRSIQAATQFHRALVQWVASASIAKIKPVTGSGQMPLSSSQHQQQQQQAPDDSEGASIDSKKLSDDIEKTWLMWLQIQTFICNLLETTNNDGIRTHCVKFIETTVLMQTPRDKFTEASFDLNLIDAPIEPIKLSDEALLSGLQGLPKNGILFGEEYKLELVEAAKRRFEQLVAFHGTSHISSVNLMAAMQSLVVLAKQRYRLFMGRVIQAIESIHSKLPPTLTESQVRSVKKFLKLQLTVILKHPYSMDRFQSQIIILLQTLGSKQMEIHKVINEYKTKFGGEAQTIDGATNLEAQKRIKLEPTLRQPTVGSQSLGSQSLPVGKSKHLDLNRLTQELDEKEKRQIVIDSVRRILGDEKRAYITPAQMEIKKKVLSTLAYEFHNTDCPKIIQDYIFEDLKNRHEICYAIIKKNYEVAVAKAVKRQINLDDDQELLKNYFGCFNSYLNRAMSLKDSKDRDIILPKLYALKAEYYNQDEDQDQD